MALTWLFVNSMESLVVGLTDHRQFGSCLLH